MRTTPIALVLLLLAGCGGGSHSVELTAPGPTATAGSDLGLASTAPLPSDLPVVTSPSADATASTSDATAAPSGAPTTKANASAIALPPLGDATYQLAGQSSLGTLPATMRFGVADAGNGSQTWTFDTSNPDGSGLIEVLTVQPGPDGIYLSDYELKANGGLWHVDLHLAPSGPAPLVPNWPHGGWEFDMPSANGCENAHTVGTVLPGESDGARHVQLVTTATPTGKADCPPIQSTRTQDLWLPAAGGRPSRAGLKLTASFGTVSGGYNYTAEPTATT